MAPRDPSTFSLRWQFAPVVSPKDGSIHWRWVAYTQSGHVFAQSKGDFDTLSECMEDARDNGYGA